MGFMAAIVVAHDKAGMRRGVLSLGLGVSPAEYALLASGTAFCEDVGPFQSSKTKAALAAFFLGAHTRLTQGGGKRRPFIIGSRHVGLTLGELFGELFAQDSYGGVEQPERIGALAVVGRLDHCGALSKSGSLAMLTAIRRALIAVSLLTPAPP